MMDTWAEIDISARANDRMIYPVSTLFHKVNDSVLLRMNALSSAFAEIRDATPEHIVPS